MRCGLPALAVVLVVGAAGGLCAPGEEAPPPRVVASHRMTVDLQERTAVTTVEQPLRNRTGGERETAYHFPIPGGAAVDGFTLWVDGKEQGGELLAGRDAAEAVAQAVRRTRDPALLEYLGGRVLRSRGFRMPPGADRRVKLSLTTTAPKDNGVVEYTFPLRALGWDGDRPGEFSFEGTIRSAQPVQNVYSPTHALRVSRKSDRELAFRVEGGRAALATDFRLFYSVGEQAVGLTPLLYRPDAGEDGYFLLLLSAQLAAGRSAVLPRDLVLVLDTSGSMDAVKMEQARKALKNCLGGLRPEDRFAVVAFSTNVRQYQERLVEASREQVEDAKQWIDGLKAGGGTAIQAALKRALDLREKDEARSFTVVFFTDGQPTIGEQRPEAILKDVAARNTANTRIFTFGVGDDVNAALLDGLAESTRAVATYVRPAEDIEAKVAALYGKILHPVLTSPKLSATGGVQLSAMYPPALPDLFQGSPLVVLGRYRGSGRAVVRLAGEVGKEAEEFAYDVTFPANTEPGARAFVEALWARRKVGFLLDRIRLHGEQKEPPDELLRLAGRYGVATPYTGHLVVPPGRVAPPGFVPAPVAPLDDLKARLGLPKDAPLAETAASLAEKFGQPGFGRGEFEADRTTRLLKNLDRGLPFLREEAARNPADTEARSAAAAAEELAREVRQDVARLWNYDQARQALGKGDFQKAQTGPVGVDVAVCASSLRSQDRVPATASRRAFGRNCVEVAGVWIDDGFTAGMKTLTVRAQSDAYFKLLEKQPRLREVFQLGTRIVFTTPSRTALVVDADGGREKLEDAEVQALFEKAGERE